jgi:hypothetical protein
MQLILPSPLTANNKTDFSANESHDLLEYSNTQVGSALCTPLVDMFRKPERGGDGQRSKPSTTFASAPFFALQNLLGLSTSAKQTAVDRT